MAGRAPSSRGSAQYAWLITSPLAIFALIALVAYWARDPGWWHSWPGALAVLAAFIVAHVGVLNIVFRRQAFLLVLNEIPLILAIYFLPAPAVILTQTIASLATQLWSRMDTTKLGYNVAKSAARTAAALVVVSLLPPIRGAGPGTWGILTAAVAIATIVSWISFAGVITVVQDPKAGQEALRAGSQTLVTAAINIIIGLVFLVALDATWWAAVPLGGLVLALAFVLRSFAEFFRQHRTLTEVYELTRAMREQGNDGSLPDVLLNPVRALMRAEYATLWLPAQGRHPEVLLTARVDDAGLLDISPTPMPVREQAIKAGHTIAVGGRFAESMHLRPYLKDSKVKDVVVVPLRSGNTSIGSLEVANRLGDATATTFRDADVRVLETIAAHVAVAVENSRLVERLRYDAYHDRLTSLPNRRRVSDALAESVKVRAPGEVVTVMLFDVDGLRDVNESMGHAAGDKLLAEVAERLRGIAGPGALVGRIGGDEFVVTLRSESTEESVRLATEMREQLRGPMSVGSLTLDVDTAAGVAVHPDHGDDPEALLRRAELAAKAAKALPYGVQLFHPALESRAVRRLGLAADLRRALDNGEMEIHFQPKVSIQDRHLIGVECLARWQHPAHGEVSPEDFVAVAEHTGQLHRLTEVVLATGLRHCREWADAGRPLSIAVNLSVRTLLDPRFPDLVHDLLKRNQVPAGQVTFEISEPGMLGEIERALPTLYRLRDLGVRLSVDDFGTGASSLSYLRQLPVHEVKIDDSFVQGMATDSGDLAIVRAVIGLSREFGLTVVAEGVESELTLDLLAELGCEIGQGYFFSRPLPVERLNMWLSAQTEPEETPTGEVRRLRAVG
ncbi:bifunctional diguanylate cyclase/phosphodiesterase [Actinoplanes sp. N902-109]|uniref:putative bifunctional diguanylate cyclase/phosphodiesterase n=1 Tax=Actinoplanes sp. (strain N902-109) TaxID=649831 RepID=UPI0003294EE6|nr:EAL domain-containing protein [Actinoplanes sp. N902-109]AGL14416.1 diguanylate cyclase/phosphodiesterase [Actinoplanes sp. N902-109]